MKIRGPDGEPLELTDLPDADSQIVSETVVPAVPDHYFGFSVRQVLGPYPPGVAKSHRRAFYTMLIPVTERGKWIADQGSGGELFVYTELTLEGIEKIKSDEEFLEHLAEQSFSAARALIHQVVERSVSG